MIIDAASAAASTGAGLPVAYAIGGSATDARIDPTEMYRVIQTALRKTASAGPTASGVSTAKTPHAVATPLPPRKRSHTGKTWPTMAARPAAAVHRSRVEPLDQHDAARALGHVEQHHRHAGADARRAQDVRGAQIATADAAQIGGSEPPRQNQRERDRADEIRQQNERKDGHGDTKRDEASRV